MFCDGGNVFERVTDFDISQLRGSVGFGVRYRSPIGPVRVDLGFKMDRRHRRSSKPRPPLQHRTGILMLHRNRTLIVFLAALGMAPAVRAEVIDRVLAVVDTQIITLSDVRAAVRFALVPQDVAVDPIAAVMQRLIDRRLMLAEVDRYAPPEPASAAVDAAMAAIERRYKDALEMEIALNQSAMSREELRRYVRDTLRLETYFQQRFSTVVQPSEDEIRLYYREHATEFTVAGKLQPLDAAREAARAAVIREQREVLLRQWVDGLRRRGAVQVLYLGK